MGAGIGSPAAGMLGLGAFVTRTGMTPAGMGADLGGMAEGIGGTLALTARDQEDERRRKIERIVDLMGRRWGRVSPDGVERCAQRVGFESMWEGGSGPKRTLSIAGQGVLIDVEFLSEQVQHVGLSFPTGGAEAMRAAPEGAEVLKRDLQGNGKGYVMLDRFVTNLERLATMDRLGVGGVSSFDAVEGIGACLRSLFGWEMQKLQKEGGGQDDRLDWETAVMCTGSGRPQMHSRGRMGLSLQYWRERKFLGRSHRGAEMDTDVDAPFQASRRKRESVVYSALIDCEACSSDIYPPIRVSSAWLSDAVGKPSEELDAFSGLFGELTVDWQEPLPTLISSEEDAAAAAATTTTDANANPTVDPMSIDGVALIATGKTPNVRFVARLDPPVIVPLQVALVIYDSVGAPIAQESITPTTFEALLFPNGANAVTTSTRTNPSSSASLTSSPTTQPQQANHTAVEQNIITYDAKGCPIPSKHKYTLFNPTQSLAHAIENIPFSHPRQIIAMLPYLRQWALLGSILRRSFNPIPIPHPSSSPSLPPSGSLPRQQNQLNSEHEPAQQDAAESPTEKNQAATTTLDEQLAAFLNSGTSPQKSSPSSSSSPLPSSTAAPKEETEPSPAPAPAPLAVDISIAFTPAPPRLTCVFELEGQLRSVVLGVNVNGEVAVLGVDTGAGSGKDSGRGVRGDAAAGAAAAGEGAAGDEAEEEQRTKDQEELDLDLKMKAQIKNVLEISESIGAVVAWLAGVSTRRAKGGVRG